MAPAAGRYRDDLDLESSNHLLPDHSGRHERPAAWIPAQRTSGDCAASIINNRPAQLHVDACVQRWQCHASCDLINADNLQVTKRKSSEALLFRVISEQQTVEPGVDLLIREE